MAALAELIERLWDDYVAITPQVNRIHRLLDERGETIHNDHIALRTFDDQRVGIEALAKPILGFGYLPKGDYEFTAKKLRARHYEHPDPDVPRIFISELKLTRFSKELQAAVKRTIDQLPADAPHQWDFPAMGRPWETTWEEYDRAATESEYAAWMLIFGFRANHFTVDVNRLRGFDRLAQLNDFLKENGFALNAAGGEIKGSPDVFLEQSSTLAEKIEIELADGKREVPGCYYEFALRHRLPGGEIFSGFVAESADKIFQSTDRR
jgi:hypothetical protein